MTNAETFRRHHGSGAAAIGRLRPIAAGRAAASGLATRRRLANGVTHEASLRAHADNHDEATIAASIGGFRSKGSGHVILRVMHGIAAADQLEELATALCLVLPDGPSPEPGLARLHLASGAVTSLGAGVQRPVVVLAFWESAEAAAVADRRGSSPLTIARRHLRDLVLEHFEIDESVRRDAHEPPRLIRIATGRFAKPGSDKEMLDVLRERVPGIGEPMADAYVGRRMIGREVQVTFVSTWREAPPDRDLAAALWADIALRYEAFEVGLFEIIPIEEPQ
jgi:hypothetical protein